MDETIRKKIWNAVDTLEDNPELLAKVSPRNFFRHDKNGNLMKDENGNYITHHKFQGTYHENYRLVKSLNLGHRPTKEETNECQFYSVAKLIGDGDAQKGIKKAVEMLIA